MRALGVAILGIGVAAGGLVIATRTEPDVARTTHAATSTSSTGVPVLAAQRFVAGTERTFVTTARYAIEIVRDHETELAPIEVTGQWRVTVARVDASSVLVKSELAGTASVGGKPSPALAAQLARPHYIQLAPAGTLVAVHFEHEQDELARGILISLATTLELPGIDGPADRWEADELDATGPYVAAYARRDATVEKTKLRYQLADAAVTELAGHATYRIDTAEWPETLASDERITIEHAPLIVRTRSQISLVRTRTATVALGTVDLRAFDVQRMGAPSRHHDVQADRDTLAGASLADLMAELATATARDSGPISERLEALLRLEPARADELARRVLAGTDRRAESILVGALGAAGTPEAQHALVDLVGAGNAQAAVASTMVDQPTAELTAALRGQLATADRSLASSSALALGVAAARLRSDGDPRGLAIVDDLLAQLAATTDATRIADLLRALGNAGDPRALPALRGALAGIDPSLRRIAVEALRSIVEPTVDALIAQVMLGDADASVRRAAAFASSSRRLEPLLPALGRALGDRDDEVRLEVVLALGQQRTAATTAMLERVATGDPDDSVRAEARRQLAGT